MADENAKIDQNYKDSLLGVAETSGQRRQIKVNETTDRLLVDSLEAAPSTIADGRKTVTDAGTAEKLVAAATICVKVIVTALESNSDVIVVGASTVVAGATGDGGGTRRGTTLEPGQALEVLIDDVSKLYIDAVVSGNGVSFVYFT